MLIKNTENRYGMPAIFLHWLMAVLIIGMLILGFTMANMSLSPLKLKFYRWHKETGILILMLVAIRFIWRETNIRPAFPLTMPRWEKWAALFVHWALYFFMFSQPIVGWLISSAAGLQVSFFGLFLLPDLIAPNETLRVIFIYIHALQAVALILFIALHAAAALKHHFYDKDDVLRRML